MAQAAYSAIIKTAGISTVFSTAESFSNLSGTTYQIDDFTKSVWDRSVTPTVYLDGVDVSTASDTVINFLFGKVTVSTAGTVTVSGNYLPVTEKSGFMEYTLSLSADVLDKTTFENNAGYHRRSLGLQDASLTMSGLRNPWVYDFTDSTYDLTSAITGSESTYTVTADSGFAVGDILRIDDEIMLITAISTAIDALTVDRGQFDTTIAAHSSDTNVYTMNHSFFSRNALLVELQPSGSTNDVWRAWMLTESLDHSGAIADLLQNSVSLSLDSSTQAGAAIANSAD